GFAANGSRAWRWPFPKEMACGPGKDRIRTSQEGRQTAGRPDACNRSIDSTRRPGRVFWLSAHGVLKRPSRESSQWHTRLQDWPITAAGPRRIRTGFPIAPTAVSTGKPRTAGDTPRPPNKIGTPFEDVQQ